MVRRRKVLWTKVLSLKWIMAEKRDFKKIMQDFVMDNPSIPQIQFMLSDDLQIDEISGKGLLNYVFQVHSKDRSQSVVIKYGEEQSKVAIEGVEYFSLERQQLEFNSLELLTDVYPGSVPHPYCLDNKHHIIAMENLQDMELLGAQLIEAHADVEVAARMGKLLATLHNRTLRHHVTQEKWKQMLEKFRQQELKDRIKTCSFDEVFIEGWAGNVIPDGAVEIYRKAVDQVQMHGLQDKLKALHDMNECFIHSDCHWNHIAIFPGSERIALLDFEFAYIGHPSFHLAMSILGYPLYYHFLKEKEEHHGRGFLGDAKAAVAMFVDAYLAETEIYKDLKSQAQFVSDLALVYGCTLFGLALFESLNAMIPLTSKQRTILLENGNHVMQEHMNIHTSAQLTEALFWEPGGCCMNCCGYKRVKKGGNSAFYLVY